MTPPRIATWLLQRMAPAPKLESLTGDLVERYARRPSKTWYWHQVVVAIVSSAWRDLLEHKLLGLLAVVVGWTTLNVFLVVAGDFISRRLLGGWVLDRSIDWSTQSDRTWKSPALASFVMAWATTIRFVPVFCVGSALSGWVVGRLHRMHRVTMLLTFGFSVLIAAAFNMGISLRVHEPSAMFVLGFPLMLWVAFLLGPPLILIGGLSGAANVRT